MNRYGVAFVRATIVLAAMAFFLAPRDFAVGQKRMATALDRTITAGSFEPKVDYLTGNQPLDVAAGDLDGDGKVDLAVTNYNSNTVSIYRNVSNLGNITDSSFKAKVDITTGTGPHGITLVDVDGDGKPDMVVTNYDINSISVFRNTSTVGNIAFANKVDFATGSYPFIIAKGDLDGDGKQDLVVSNYHSDCVSIFRNTCILGSITDSSFAPRVNFATGSFPQGVAICNVDEDGKPDIIVTNSGSNSISVLKNKSTVGIIADSSFASKIDFQTGNYPFSLSVGDLDGDGKIDVATCNYSTNTVSIFRNTTSGDSITGDSFSPKVDYSTGREPYYVTIGDLNQDGKPELVVSSSTDNALSVYQNRCTIGSITDTSFRTRVNFSSTNFPCFPVLCDVDGDGKSEMVVTNRNGNTISVFRNTVGTPAAPILLSATGGDGRASLKWNRSAEADFLRYRIYCDTLPHPVACVDSSIAIADTSRVIAGLANNKLYYFRATTVDNGGLESSYSNEVEVIPSPNPPPAAPQNLSATRGDSFVDLKWQRNGELDFLRYRIYCDTIAHPSQKVDSTSANVTDTSCTVAGLINDKSYYFRVTAVDSSGLESAFSNEVSATPGTVGVEDDQKLALIPKQFVLHQNFPNPFNPSTMIRFDLPEQSTVKLVIYDMLGREIATLLDGTLAAGYRSIEWKANVATGLYFYRIDVASIDDPGKRFVSVKKMLLLR